MRTNGSDSHTGLEDFDTVAIRSSELAAAALSGQPRHVWCVNIDHTREFRTRVPLESRRALGAFFTSSALASMIARQLPENAKIHDPACGLGDLLLAHAQRLQVRKTLGGTIAEWGALLGGWDIEPRLAEVARARLVLLAAARYARTHGKVGKANCALADVFPYVVTHNSLKGSEAIPAPHIVVNPPFGITRVNGHTSWARGNVTAAAVFLETTLASARKGTEVHAILPDVLRSGSRYSRWRAAIERRAEVCRVSAFGRFDPFTDVDVFTLKLRVRESALEESQRRSEWIAEERSFTLGDLFSVSVGPLVPFRAEERGPWRDYLEAGVTPRNGSIAAAPCRRFDGRTHEPPFVVIRRTSSPSDKQRAVPTLVTGSRKFAVENHLIVLEPWDGRVSTCKILMRVLRGESTNAWFNARIRCRHLTTTSVAELPLNPSDFR